MNSGDVLDFISIEDVSKITSLTKKQIRDFCQRKALRFYLTTGRHRRFLMADVLDFCRRFEAYRLSAEAIGFKVSCNRKNKVMA